MGNATFGLQEDFTGGLNTAISPRAVQPGQCANLNGFKGLVGGGLQGRSGRDEYIATAVPANYRIISFAQHTALRSGDTSKTLAVVVDTTGHASEIRYYDSGTPDWHVVETLPINAGDWDAAWFDIVEMGGYTFLAGLYPDGDIGYSHLYIFAYDLGASDAARCVRAGHNVPLTNCTTAVGAATGLTGTYRYYYTYVYDTGEGALSPVSADVTVANQKVTLASFDTHPSGYREPEKIRIYREKLLVAGGNYSGPMYIHQDTYTEITTNGYTDFIADSTLTVPAPDQTALCRRGVPPQGQFLCVHADRLLVGRCREIDAWEEPNERALDSTIFYSEKGMPQVFRSTSLDLSRGGGATSWQYTCRIPVFEGDGQKIMGMESFAGVVVIPKTSSLCIMTGSDPETFRTHKLAGFAGCVAEKTVTETPYGVCWLGENDVWMYDGTGVRALSDNIASELVAYTLAEKQGACGVYYHRKYYLHIPGASSTGYTYIYDFRTQEWYKDDYATAISFRQMFTDEAGVEPDLLLVADRTTSEAKLWKISSGVDDNGSDIKNEVYTRYFDFGQPNRIKHFKGDSIWVQYRMSEGPETLAAYFRRDNGTSSSVVNTTLAAATTWGQARIGIPAGSRLFRSIQVRFSITHNRTFRILGMTFPEVEFTEESETV